MDLIEITEIVKQKEKQRDQLLGRKSILIDGLKELGFNSLKEAKVEIKEKEKELTKMELHYQKGVKRFKEKFEHLLGA
jgi:diacylglycerol kinase family enzyme